MENEIKKELTEVEEAVAETAETAEEKAVVIEEAVTETVEEICEPVALDETAAETAVEETAEAVEEAPEETAVEEAAEAIEEAPEETVAEEPAEVPAETAAEEAAETVEEVPAETVAAAPAETATAVEEAPEKPKALGKRIVSALFGWLGIFTSSTSVLGIVFGIISICLGFSAKKKSGKGRFAITLGFISLILGILFLAASIYLVYCLFVNFDWAVETFNLPQEFADAWNSIIG